jgi:peptidoglycan/xylan/chitin deacetylase (PgdA/CDA1 family)
MLITLFWSVNAKAAVVLQYHHVDDTTPRITSVTKNELRTHLNWLQDNGFEILPLPELIKRVQDASLDEHKKIASITFDDLGPSICTNAWPILKELSIPFTLFINTVLIEKGTQKSKQNSIQCTWQDLKVMNESGLATIANHTHTHPHMLHNHYLTSFFHNQKDNKEEIVYSQNIIDKELGRQQKIFAYPYGEYNKEIERLVDKLGYVAFGQQSGAIGNHSKLTELPRFPMSGQHANINTIPDKLLSLPFPIQKEIVSENPSIRKNPELRLYFTENFSNKVQCFSGDGTKIETLQGVSYVSAKSQHLLKEGRIRYNCTAPSKYRGRFYWYSQQWVYKN